MSPGAASPPVPSPSRRPWLARLALDRPELRAWAMYDWANSAMFTVIVTAVYPVFFTDVVAAALAPEDRLRAHAAATTVSLAVGAVLGPVLGTLADVARLKKVLLAVFLALGAGSAAGMFLLGPGDVTAALWLFGLCNLGAVGSFVFYDALLPHVAREDEVDQLSTSAYALGYLGGGLCLLLAVALVYRPGWFGLPSGEGLDPAAKSLPARIGFVVVAVWWVVFSVPLFLRVSEPPLAVEPDEEAGRRPVRTAFVRLAETFRALRGYRQAFLMVVAFLIYNDGIGTIIRSATMIGRTRGIGSELMLGVVVLVQFVGVPFTVLFGRLAARFGPKRSILGGLAVYGVICALAYGLSTGAEFVALAVLVSMVQGGCQALSRSLFASLIPRYKSGEFFGLFSSLEKFAGVLGPMAVALIPSTGGAVLAILGFFVVGAGLLLAVDVEAGRRQARAEEARVRHVAGPACGPEGPDSGEPPETRPAGGG
jgi:MFS transporter, UMF1 family